jgi:hypothetical protein
MKRLSILALLLFALNSYTLFSLDWQFTWTLFEFGVVNTSEKDNYININVFLNFLKFNWVECNTGIGINFSFYNYGPKKGSVFVPHLIFSQKYWEENRFPAGLIPSTELIWNPIVKETNDDPAKAGFLNFGFYNRFEYAGNASVGWGFVDTIGARVFWSRLPVGRTSYVYENYLNWYTSAFLEYSTDKIFTVGVLLAI